MKQIEGGWTWARLRTVSSTDILPMVVVTAMSVGALYGSRERSGVPASVSDLSLALTLLSTLPLIVRRRYPIAVLGVCEIAEALFLATAPLTMTQSALGMAVALYTVATRTDRHTSLRLGLGVAVINVLVLLPGVPLGRANITSAFFGATAMAVGSWSLGENVRTRRAYLAQLEERARRLETEREENARRAVSEERARIARELHDVVAHHVSAIAVQAAAAGEIAERDPRRAQEALRFIQETSRVALAEMRAMLNVLRSSDEPAPARAPQPSLAQLERLVNQSCGAGLGVSLQVEGSVRPLPEALDVSAYRIVQEALTNSLKHAGPAHVQVLVRYGDDTLELDIVDDGRGPAGHNHRQSEGRGLIGMRERVALFGGELETGALPGHGFRVRAQLPLPQP